MRSLILETSMRAVFHTVLLFSVFLLFSGHNRPGGGFAGGLVAGAALVLRAIALRDADNRVRRVPSEKVLGVGLVLTAGTGIAAWFAGRPLLTSGLLERYVPVLGAIKAPSVVVFDIGVYLVVVGLVAAVLESLGEQEPM